MVDADKNDDTSSSTDSSNADKSKGNEALNTQLNEVQEQLRKMNAQMEATQNAIAESNRAKVKKEDEDDNIYDPKKLLQRVEASFDSKLKSERQKDIMIYNLSQEYPEIQTDAKIRQAVLEAQKSIPESMRDTADGYEMAVLKAVSRAGLIPKTKRQSVDDDTSLGGSRGTRPTPKARTKVSEKTLMVAQLLGRDISDEKVLKGLEEAANRDNYTKYR